MKIIKIIEIIKIIIIDTTRENFKWMVDSYRMKWRPSEPNQGQLETEVFIIMIVVI